MTYKKPVLAMDVDGVLNPFGGKNQKYAPEGFNPYRVEIPHSLFGSFTNVKEFDFDLDRPLVTYVWLNEKHGVWLNKMAKIADVVWATTWEDAANHAIAPILGLDPLPLGVSTLVTPPKPREIGPQWKRRSLYTQFGDRPLVWIDDWAWEFESKDWWPNAPGLLVSPVPFIGLTDEEMQKAEDFLTVQSLEYDLAE